LWRNKQSLDKEGQGNAAFRVGEVYQLAGFEGTLMAGYESGFLATYTVVALREFLRRNPRKDAAGRYSRNGG
jgi:hypothetical protein